MAGMPFDVTLKDLIEENARAWADRFYPYPILDVAVIDADVSTVTARADKVLRVQETSGAECLLNIEAEGSHAADIPDRLLHYSILLRHRHAVPVRSVVILLRRSANASLVTGTLEVRRRPDEPPYLTFAYEVVRLWTQPLAPLLAGPLGLLPLAPLTDEAQADLPGVVQHIVGRLRTETTREQAGKMETATLILMGMLYEDAFVEQLFRGVQEMEESTTYQSILRRGEKRGEERGAMQTLRETILRQGRRKFGEPSADQVQFLEEIANLERLQVLTDRVSDASSWQELLA
jgi:predicted transposase YdaD